MHRSAWIVTFVLTVALVVMGLSAAFPVQAETWAQGPPRSPATFTATHTATATEVTATNTATATEVTPATSTSTATGTPVSPTKAQKTKVPQPQPAQPAAAPSAHLSLGLVADPIAPAAQGEVVYTIQVTNDGNAQADGVVVSCDVPVGMRVLGATTGQGTAAVTGNQVTVQLGSLAAGQSISVTIETQLESSVGAGVPLSLTASATADGGLSAISLPVVVQIPAVPNTGFGFTVILLTIGLVLAAIVLITRGLQMRRPVT